MGSGFGNGCQPNAGGCLLHPWMLRCIVRRKARYIRARNMAHHIPFLSDLSAQHQLKQRLTPVVPKAVERRMGDACSSDRGFLASSGQILGIQSEMVLRSIVSVSASSLRPRIYWKFLIAEATRAGIVHGTAPSSGQALYSVQIN